MHTSRQHLRGLPHVVPPSGGSALFNPTLWGFFDAGTPNFELRNEQIKAEDLEVCGVRGEQVSHSSHPQRRRQLGIQPDHLRPSSILPKTSSSGDGYGRSTAPMECGFRLRSEVRSMTGESRATGWSASVINNSPSRGRLRTSSARCSLASSNVTFCIQESWSESDELSSVDDRKSAKSYRTPHASPHGVPPSGGRAPNNPTREDFPTSNRLKPGLHTWECLSVRSVRFNQEKELGAGIAKRERKTGGLTKHTKGRIGKDLCKDSQRIHSNSALSSSGRPFFVSFVSFVCFVGPTPGRAAQCGGATLRGAQTSLCGESLTRNEAMETPVHLMISVSPYGHFHPTYTLEENQGSTECRPTARNLCSALRLSLSLRPHQIPPFPCVLCIPWSASSLRAN